MKLFITSIIIISLLTGCRAPGTLPAKERASNLQEASDTYSDRTPRVVLVKFNSELAVLKEAEHLPHDYVLTVNEYEQVTSILTLSATYENGLRPAIIQQGYPNKDDVVIVPSKNQLKAASHHYDDSEGYIFLSKL